MPFGYCFKYTNYSGEPSIPRKPHPSLARSSCRMDSDGFCSLVKSSCYFYLKRFFITYGHNLSNFLITITTSHSIKFPILRIFLSPLCHALLVYRGHYLWPDYPHHFLKRVSFLLISIASSWGWKEYGGGIRSCLVLKKFTG